MADKRIAELPLTPVAQFTDLLEIERPGDVSYSLPVSAIIDLASAEDPPTQWGDIVGVLSEQTDLQAALDAKAPDGAQNTAVWGGIGGTLSNQTDLQAALDEKLTDAPSDGNQYARQNATWTIVNASTAWGSITGVLSNQTDLQAALDAKANLSGATFSGNVTVNGVFSSRGITDNATATALTVTTTGRLLAIPRTPSPSFSGELFNYAAEITDSDGDYQGGIGWTNVGGGSPRAAMHAFDDGTAAATGLVFAVRSNAGVYGEAMRINSDGSIQIPDLAGTGARDVQVQADGTLIAV